jgi:signal transduction histidine kinase
MPGRAMLPRGRLGRPVCVAFVLLASTLLPPQAVRGEEPQKRVLVIYTSRRDTQFSSLGDQLLPELLEQGLGSKVDYSAEYLDPPRFEEPQYARAFRDYFQLKYQGTRFDAIVTTHSLALDFVTANRAAMFPGTPVAFFTDSPETTRPVNSAGLISARDYRATIDLARQLQPDTRQVFVIVGNSPRDRAAERVAREQFAAYSPPLTFNYLSGLTTVELERTLKAMPEHSIAYYVLFYQDAAGVNVTPLEYLGRIAAMANRPVYSWIDSTVEHGVIGGGFTTISLQIHALADLAVRVLRGEQPDSIPVLTPDTVEKQVDWRQLRRWGISESRVPEGARVLFRTPTIWERYRIYIVGISALLLGQSALIGILLVQRRRLRRAEETVRHGQADLKASRDRIRDLGGRLLAAQDAERSRIALELHDDISQQLAVLTMNLQMLCGFGEGRDDDAEAVARETLDQADGISQSLRDLSHRLYPAKLRLLGLVPAIAGLEHDLSSPNLIVRFTHDGVPSSLAHFVTLTLYRVVQEALRNAIAHSDAREVRVRLEGRGGSLFLTIVDDGIGFDVDGAMGRGLGLISMRERLDAIGGALTITSAPGMGTRIEIVLAEMAAHAPAPLGV